ncbi:Peptidase S8/S53 domain superfamily [Sesbania bispinosa]|nr:Peptidase S8/S53 domain superfamily [Sesbania bispinosa]
MNKLHTTHSWDFLGLDSAYKSDNAAPDSASNVIVGVIDSGPVPEKFKGKCVTGDNFTLANCNK